MSDDPVLGHYAFGVGVHDAGTLPGDRLTLAVSPTYAPAAPYLTASPGASAGRSRASTAHSRARHCPSASPATP
jgi:hypothetical protein